MTRTMCTLGLCASLLACSADDGTTTNERSGRFLDAAVQGLTYQTETVSGVTDVDGGFDYRSGESVVFSIGEIDLPGVTGREIVTALDIFNSDDPARTDVVNLNRLLQSLDANGDPSDGIDLLTLDLSSTAGLTVDFASSEFDSQVINLVANSGSVNTSLIDAGSATAHFQQTLEENGLSASGCSSDHPLVGASATFTTRFHDVSGMATVLDDCTIEVTEFNYDGLGPTVFFYIAQDGDFGGVDARRIGERLNGRTYINDEFRLTLPETRTLDDINSLSVWCTEFGISFGDLVFSIE